MHLAIDAINIRQGGGITHLAQMLQVAQPNLYGFKKVTVWSSRATADLLPDRPWLVKRSLPWMDSSLLRRIIGHQFQFGYELVAHKCDVLFSPGGTFPRAEGLSMVAMSQNMLPFEPVEAYKFGRLSLMRLKMYIIKMMQMRSFKRANGLIFLSEYAERVIKHALDYIPCRSQLVKHGIESRFFQEPRQQRKADSCSAQLPFKILYVSILMPYKHQKEVALAAADLYAKGIPIEMRFIGASWGNYGLEFKEVINKIDPDEKFLIWNGPENFEDIPKFYCDADAFVFASSCENLPNILIEAMASGLAIASSDRGPMPEVLGSAGIYFNPESFVSIADALTELINDDELRKNLAYEAWRKAQQYSWERCAHDTFKFIADVAQKNG